MQCFKWISKSRKCAICDRKVQDYNRYNLMDEDPAGIVWKSTQLTIRLKDIHVAKRNQVLCNNCHNNIEKLIDFKNRIEFTNNTVFPAGLLIRKMCSICYEYNPTNMSGTFDKLISSNERLISYTFEIDFSKIVNDMKLTCEDCMRHLYLFCKIHMTFQRVHPQKDSMVVDVSESSSSIGRRLSSMVSWCSNATLDGLQSEAVSDLNNENFRRAGPSNLRRIPSIQENLNLLETLYQHDSSLDSNRKSNSSVMDVINSDVEDRQLENNGIRRQLSETSNFSSSLETISESPFGPSNSADEQQTAVTGQQGNRIAKLKRLFSRKRKDSNPAETDDQESKKSKEGKKRKAKTKKVAE